MAGMDCAETLTSKTRVMLYNDTINFLEDGAICQSSSDYHKNKTTLDQACKILGPKCTADLKKLIKSIK